VTKRGLWPPILAPYDIADGVHSNIAGVSPERKKPSSTRWQGFMRCTIASACFGEPELITLMGGRFRVMAPRCFIAVITQPNRATIRRGFGGGFDTSDRTYVHDQHNEINPRGADGRVETTNAWLWTWTRTGKGTSVHHRFRT
jgi:hypothetical protein